MFCSLLLCSSCSSSVVCKANGKWTWSIFQFSGVRENQAESVQQGGKEKYIKEIRGGKSKSKGSRSWWWPNDKCTNVFTNKISTAKRIFIRLASRAGKSWCYKDYIYIQIMMIGRQVKADSGAQWNISYLLI